MKTQKFALAHLKSKVWWWRRQTIRRSGVSGGDWDKRTKAAVLNYELMRRSPGAIKLNKTYLELNGTEKAFVHVLFCDWPMQVCRFATITSFLFSDLLTRRILESVDYCSVVREGSKFCTDS